MSFCQNAVGWSALCDYGMSWSYSFAFCVGSLFHGVVIGFLPRLAINLLGCFTLF